MLPSVFFFCFCFCFVLFCFFCSKSMICEANEFLSTRAFMNKPETCSFSLLHNIIKKQEHHKRAIFPHRIAFVWGGGGGG